jgi:hypothetical protein
MVGVEAETAGLLSRGPPDVGFPSGLQDPGASPRAVALSLGAFPSVRYRRIGLAFPPRPWTSARWQSPARRPTSPKPRGLPASTCARGPLPAPGRYARGVEPARECDLLPGAAELRTATPLMRLGDSFSTIHLPSPLCPGLPHPVRSAPRVSHPPGGLLLDRLPGLVSCRSAHGAFPFRAFPSLGAVPPLGGPCPPAVHPVARPAGLSTCGPSSVAAHAAPASAS